MYERINNNLGTHVTSKHNFQKNAKYGDLPTYSIS